MAIHHVFHTGTFLLLVATLLLLFTTISSPIIHNLAFLKVTDGNSALSFGALGYCVLNAGPSGGSSCSQAKIGYDITGIISTATHTQYANSVLNNLTHSLVLHPVTTGLTFIALLIATSSYICGFVCGSLLAGVTWLIMLVVIIIDFSLFGTVRTHVNGNLSGARAEYGVAIWLTVAAFIVLFFASIMTCCAGCTDGRRSRSRKSRW